MKNDIDWAKNMIRSTVENCKVIRREKRLDGGFYNYIILPFEDVLDGAFSKAIAMAMDEAACHNCDTDMLFAPEAKGMVAAGCYRDWLYYNLNKNIPVNYIRKRHYGTDDEIIIHRAGNAYGSGADFSIKSVRSDTRGRFVDDIISSGETVATLINGIKKQSVAIDCALIVFERGNGKEYIQDKTGVPVRPVARIDVKRDNDILKPIIEKFYI